MHVAYLVTTVLAALANGAAAFASLTGAEFVQAVADRVQVGRKWMVPFGTLLTLGALGLLAGIWVPVLGEAAATGLIFYFVCALGAHVRARDAHVGGAVSFLLLAVAALLTSLRYHEHWS
ncbi:MAG TPA: DoxX family protein [Polyangiaceae bacterium]|nr:DoxX family protein [Polyangiaceae bacterium]